jgi:hypothetical protein
MVLIRAILFYFQKPILITIKLSDLQYRRFEANKSSKNSSDLTCTTSLNFHYFWAPKNTTKRKAIPLQAWTGPEGSRRLRIPDSCSGRPYTPGNIPGTHFC